jgi:hypothetical protein
MYNLKDKAESFTQMNNHDCINAYMDPRKATSELILVSTVCTGQNVGNGTASLSILVKFDEASSSRGF